MVTRPCLFYWIVLYCLFLILSLCKVKQNYFLFWSLILTTIDSRYIEKKKLYYKSFMGTSSIQPALNTDYLFIIPCEFLSFVFLPANFFLTHHHPTDHVITRKLFVLAIQFCSFWVSDGEMKWPNLFLFDNFQ